MQRIVGSIRGLKPSTIPLRGGRGWDWYYRAKEMQKVKEQPSNIWDNQLKKKRTRVYFDIGSENKETTRFVVELLDDIVPKTSQNFQNLVKGEAGLGYKNCGFFDIRKGEFVCSGAVKGEKRLGGYSSFGTQYFEDENFCAQYPFPFPFLCSFIL